MILPTRRWFVVAGGLALVVLFALRWPGGDMLLLGLDALWVLALAVDA